MVVLVTGGAGFIGSHTVDALIEKGFDVYVIDNLQKPIHLKGKPKYLNPRAKYIWGDVTNRETMLSLLKKVDYVYHFAAYQDYLTDFSRFFYVNSVSTALIYELVLEYKLEIKKVIVASSQFVQGEGVYKTKNGGIYLPTVRENADLKKRIWEFFDSKGNIMKWQWTKESHFSPPNQYAISKYSQEMIAMNLGKRYSIPSVALRYSIVQGERQSFYNAYSGACRIFCLHYYFNKAPSVYEDGKMKRDFVNIKDVVRANILVLESESAIGQVFNVGGGKAISVYDFAVKVSKAFDKEELKPKINGFYRYGDTRNACSDIRKIKKLLGWEPKIDVNQNIEEYKEYLCSQKDIEDILNYAEQNMKKLNVIRKSSG